MEVISGFNNGKGITSLIDALLVINIISLSMPMPNPPVGGMPISKAFKKSSSIQWASRSPLSLYLKGSWIKLTIGVGKGKKIHDKRQDEKQKSMKKEINSALKR